VYYVTQPELKVDYLPSQVSQVLLPKTILCSLAQRMLMMRIVAFLAEHGDSFSSKVGVVAFLTWSGNYKMIHPDYNVQLGEVANCQIRHVEAIYAMYDIDVLVPEGRGAEFWVGQAFIDALRPFVVK